MWLTRPRHVDVVRTTTPHSLSVQVVSDFSRVVLVQRHETYSIASPARSITKLGIMKFVLSEEPRSGGQPRAKGIVELPSFSEHESLRPTVQMPPLVEQRRERPAPRSGSEGGMRAARGSTGGAVGSLSRPSSMSAWLLR
jgi:hypothetical protein